MEEQEPAFDRQAFIAQNPREQRRASHLGGLMFALIAIILVSGAGVGAYKFASSNGTLFAASGGTELAQVIERLDEIDRRLNQLEKKPRAAPADVPADPAAPPTPLTTALRERPGLVGLNIVGAANPAPPGESKTESPGRGQEVDSLRTELGQKHEAWEAATDRIAGALTELGAQREQIASNKKGLNDLMDRFQHSEVAFTLTKKMGQQRVGPLWLWLRDTQIDKQRYTLRVFLDDRWVEIKERVLFEPVEFYSPRSSVPMQLVITKIDKDDVAGYLAVPREKPKR